MKSCGFARLILTLLKSAREGTSRPRSAPCPPAPPRPDALRPPIPLHSPAGASHCPASGCALACLSPTRTCGKSGQRPSVLRNAVAPGPRTAPSKKKGSVRSWKLSLLTAQPRGIRSRGLREGQAREPCERPAEALRTEGPRRMPRSPRSGARAVPGGRCAVEALHHVRTGTTAAENCALQSPGCDSCLYPPKGEIDTHLELYTGAASVRPCISTAHTESSGL